MQERAFYEKNRLAFRPALIFTDRLFPFGIGAPCGSACHPQCAGHHDGHRAGRPFELLYRQRVLQGGIFRRAGTGLLY
ncbi:hypothetical protein SDC9_120594 [bioreactor metagenome]|uniref:Uncharacterized protein n=1 Tax=bioreactor metagenome TaxID=1076179 RepID=A0A645C7D8_9ZZZZ